MKKILVLVLVAWSSAGSAQIANSWIKSTSGSWEIQTAWSLGSLPGPGQTVTITNQGWKAVAIGASTAQNFPQSLNVSNVILGGYTDSFNLLLLNYSGFAVPLTAGSVNVGTNSGITVLASALTVSSNSGPGDLSIFSTFIQSDNANVTAHNINLGNFTNAAAGAGIYYETNGIANADELSLADGSTFNQFGGADDFGTIWLGAADTGDTGVYNIANGYLTAGSIVAYRGSFNQSGGSVAASVGLGDCTYTLSGGVLNLPGITIPYVWNSQRNPSYAGMSGTPVLLQTGGTNFCNGNLEVYDTTAALINVPFWGVGRYVLSNGVLCVTGTVQSWMGNFQQWGGWHTNAGTEVTGDTRPYYELRTGSFSLGGGTLLTPLINVGLGTFTQSGGTNYVSGNVTVGTESPSTFTLSGGLLTNMNVFVTGANSATPSGQLAFFIQIGGLHNIANLLHVSGWVPGNYWPTYSGYVLSNAVLTVPNIQLDNAAFFQHDGGTLTTAGLLTLGYSTWAENTTGQQFGQLLLSAPAGTNATFSLPSSGTCVVHFANSSSLIWSNQAGLLVANWHGSPSGGGASQFYFGSNSSGLTPQQLSQIIFTNPAGFASGSYTAKILSTGEIVPNHSSAPPSGLVNNWISPNSGKWENSTSWSLGTPPASNQFVTITDHGFISVNIDSTTVANDPASMTVSNLLVGAPDQTYSTLLLNYFGLTTPLKVLNSCVVSNNAYLLNYGSSFEVDGTNASGLTINGGSFEQVGGQTVATGSVNVTSGYLRATNANLTLGQLTLGAPGTYGYVQHDGGSIASTFVNVVQGSYSLAHGTLYAIQGSQLSSPLAVFIQSGGTNYGNIGLFENSTYQLSGGMAQGDVLSVSESLNHFTFEQDNGLLQMQFIDVTGGSNYTGFPCFEVYSGIVSCGTLNIGGNGTFGQAGGQVVLSNNLDMHGEFFITSRGNITEHSDYLLNGGQLQAPSISLGQFATFRQYGGSVALPGGLNLTLSSALYHLDGGSLSTTYSGISGDFRQTGGHHSVNGVLSLVGSYELQAGDLVVQGLYTRGTLSLVGSGAFTNTGLVNLGGAITTSASNAVMGQIQLATNTTLGFSGFPARVYCSSSSGISWTAGALLTITNWSSTRDGHICFGTTASGLTASQLAQIQFSNPGGFAPGVYPAQILSTGEVVPVPRPSLVSSRSGSSLVLTWSGSYQLLSSTNVAGPYVPVSGASSPWTNHFTKPQEFFILRGM